MARSGEKIGGASKETLDGQTDMTQRRQGLFYAVVAYVIWATSAIYWKLLSHVPPVEILMHRILWTLAISLITIIVTGDFEDYKRRLAEMWREKTPFFLAVGAAICILFNWGIYIWSVTNNRIIDAALGYYMNPIVSIVTAYLFLNERLNKLEWAAAIISVVGVLSIVVYNGTLPWISLMLALSFGTYGLLKKKTKLKAVQSMCFECTVLMLVAVPLLINFHLSGSGSFNFNYTGVFLIVGGLLTLTPLILFSLSLQRISLSTMGFVQYLNPTLAFLIGYFIYREPLQPAYLIAFVFIWFGVILYLYSTFIKGKRAKKT